MSRNHLVRLAPVALMTLLGACKDDGKGSEGGGTDGTDTDPTTGPTTSVSSTGTDSGTDGTSTVTTGETETDTGGGEGTLDELIQALCEYEFRCCSDGELDYRLGPFTDDASECKERYLAELNSNNNDNPVLIGSLLDSLGYSIRLERVNVNPAAVNECIAQVEAADCNQKTDPDAHCEPTRGANPCALDSLFSGKQTVGSVCNPNLAPDVECAAGSKCVVVTGNIGECEVRAVDGEFCSSVDDCDDGLYCNFMEGTCAPKGDIGDPCSFENDANPVPGTETEACRDELTCDPAAGECAAFCTAGYDCSADVHCPSGLSCVPADPGSGFTYCRMPGTAGAPCDSKKDCTAGNYCQGQNCALAKNINDACFSDDECVAGYCNVTCQNFKAAGDACTLAKECNPATTVGCFTSGDGMLCRSALLANDAVCVDGENSCSSGVCDANAMGFRCMVGEQAGDECDADPLTPSVNKCAQGLYCDTDGKCKAKSAAGGSCTDDSDLQCINGNCDEMAPWGSDMCTDAPDSSDTVTCDGMG